MEHSAYFARDSRRRTRSRGTNHLKSGHVHHFVRWKKGQDKRQSYRPLSNYGRGSRWLRIDVRISNMLPITKSWRRQCSREIDQ